MQGTSVPQQPLESIQLELRALTNELRDQVALADVGELAGPLIHEFNNFLNTVLLQLAVLEPSLTPASLRDLEEVRRQATDIADVIKQIQPYRRRIEPRRQVVDLNQVVKETVASLEASATTNGVAIKLLLSPAQPRIEASAIDTRRLISFLVHCASRSRPRDSDGIVVYTDMLPNHVQLGIEVETVDPNTSCRLEWSACKSIVSRMKGSLRHVVGYPRSMIVEWHALRS